MRTKTFVRAHIVAICICLALCGAAFLVPFWCGIAFFCIAGLAVFPAGISLILCNPNQATQSKQ